MSGYAPEAEPIADLLVPGRIALLQKPFLASDLAAQIRALLDEQHPVRPTVIASAARWAPQGRERR